MLGPVEWTPLRVRQAVTWLSQRVGKPLLKLTDADYNAHSLQVSSFNSGSDGMFCLAHAVAMQPHCNCLQVVSCYVVGGHLLLVWADCWSPFSQAQTMMNTLCSSSRELLLKLS